LPTGDRFSINLEREYRQGPAEPATIAALDALRPHLARAATMTVRLRLDRARVAGETLAALGLPALVLAEGGKVLAANAAMESLTGVVAWRAFDRASLKDRKADKLFQTAIAGLAEGHGAAVRSFPVRAPADETAMVAHLVPIRLSARDIFVRCAAALVLAPISMPEAPPVELVRSLFDLTPAEARVARALASGETVETIAVAGGLSTSTIRTQVRGVLEKTGCRRQTDLVAILGSIALPHHRAGGSDLEPRGAF
jgi:DNA-binding CsgD family transcriptional regulator